MGFYGSRTAAGSSGLHRLPAVGWGFLLSGRPRPSLRLRILRHAGLQAGGLHSNVLKDEATNLFLEIGVAADLGARGLEAIFASHLRQILILAMGRIIIWPLTLRVPRTHSIALPGLERVSTAPAVPNSNTSPSRLDINFLPDLRQHYPNAPDARFGRQ